MNKLTYQPDDMDYIHGRLNGGYVTTADNTIVNCRTVLKDTKKGVLVHIRNPKKDIDDMCELSKLNLEPFPLGNLNFRGDAWFISRMPYRGYKQATTNRNLICSQGAGAVRLNFIEELYPLQPTVDNKFYSFDECLEMLEDGYKRRAFNRSWMLDDKFNLIYRGNYFVGSFDPHSDKIRLKEKFFWLKEDLDESLSTGNKRIIENV